ncbi:beta-ketoacyl-ACP synthase [Ramlibacter henchirensis]|uniref:Beta-ketoacyl-ACP synthase n=1 Tax=Ramlibacter henchirensis TaxID=204072 RepID=A0A4Z0BPS5_9BURK|nr:beta-ketoacyl-ACP synthase [Ramlibacter henchirensis]TFZ00400.1 beta-ketoacyl-ACP synthase [Ramlibacter henchirensis]
MSPVYLQAPAWLSALGRGTDAREAMFGLRSAGMAVTERYTPGRPLHLGCVTEPLPSLESQPVAFRSRTNALLAAVVPDLQPMLETALSQHGPDRIAVVLGVSAAGLQEGVAAARQFRAQGSWPAGYDYAQQEMGNAAAFLKRALGLRGPAYTVSTACSSSAKALASAARLLHAGIADAVVAGGVDALSGFTIGGFSALESVSAQRCNPLSAHRSGINIGEGAALFVVSREPSAVRLAGWGESSDAHHMSAPEPGGRGALAAMEQALARAGIPAGAIDYVNLHGTATRQNDAMEALAVARLLGHEVPVSSTKPLTGHALAAAGAIEAAIAWHTLAANPSGRLPPHLWDGVRDPELARVRVVAAGESLGRSPRHVLSNSFAFGGSNACLVFSGE